MRGEVGSSFVGGIMEGGPIRGGSGDNLSRVGSRGSSRPQSARPPMVPPLRPVGLDSSSFQNLLAVAQHAAEDRRRIETRAQTALTPRVPSSKPPSSSSARPGWLSERNAKAERTAATYGGARPQTARERAAARASPMQQDPRDSWRPTSSPGRRVPEVSSGRGPFEEGGDVHVGEGEGHSPWHHGLSVWSASPSVSSVDAEASSVAGDEARDRDMPSFEGRGAERRRQQQQQQQRQGHPAGGGGAGGGWEEEELELEQLLAALSACAGSLNLHDTIEALRGAAQDALQCQFVNIFQADLDTGILIKCEGESESKFASHRGIAGSVCRLLGGGSFSSRRSVGSQETWASDGLEVVEGVVEVKEVQAASEYDAEVDDAPSMSRGAGAGTGLGGREAAARNLVSSVARDAKGRTVALVQAANKNGGFGRRDRRLLRVICRQAGTLIGLCLEAGVAAQKMSEDNLRRKFGARIVCCVRPDDLGQALCDYGRACLHVQAVYFCPLGRVRGKLIGPNGLRATTIVERVAATGEGLVVPDVERDQQYMRVREIIPSCSSLVAVAVRSHTGARCLGVLLASSTVPERFSRRDIDRVSVLLATFAVALERILLLESSLAMQEKLPGIFSEKDTNGTLLKAQHVACDFLNGTSCRIHMHNASSGKVWHVNESYQRVEQHPGKGFVHDVITTGKPLESPDALVDPDFDKDVDAPSAMSNWYCAVPMLVIPIWVDGGSRPPHDPLKVKEGTNYGLPGSFEVRGDKWKKQQSFRQSAWQIQKEGFSRSGKLRMEGEEVGEGGMSPKSEGGGSALASLGSGSGGNGKQQDKDKGRDGSRRKSSIFNQGSQKNLEAEANSVKNARAPKTIVSAVMVVARRTREEFGDSDRDLALMLSQAVAVALSACLRQEMAEVVLSETEQMLRTAHDMSRHADMQDIVWALHSAAKAHSAATSCNVYLSHDMHPSMTKLQCYTMVGKMRTNELVPVTTSAVLSACISLRCVINVESVETMMRLAQHHGGHTRRLHMVSSGYDDKLSGYTRDNFEPEMAVPLFNRVGGLLGVVKVTRKAGSEGFSDGEEAQLDYVTALAAVNLVKSYERRALEVDGGRLKGRIATYRQGVLMAAGLARAEPDETAMAQDFLQICTGKLPCAAARLLWVTETEMQGGEGLQGRPALNREVIGVTFQERSMVGSEWVSTDVTVDRGIAFGVVQMGASVVVNDVQVEVAGGEYDARTDSAEGGLGDKVPSTIMGVPVWAAGEGEGDDGRLVAVVMHYNRVTGAHESQRHFSEGDVHLAETLARVLSVQLASAGTFTSLTDSISYIGRLHASVTNVWALVEESALSATKCKHFVYLALKPSMRDDGDALRFTVMFPFDHSGDSCTCIKGALFDCVALGTTVNITSSNSKATPSSTEVDIDTGKPLVWDNDGFPFLKPSPGQPDAGAGRAGGGVSSVLSVSSVWWQSALMCPVFDEGGETTGCLVLLDAARGYFTHSDAEVVASLTAAARSKMALTAKQRALAITAEARKGVVRLSSDMLSRVSRGVPGLATCCVAWAAKLTGSQFAAVYLNNVGDKAGLMRYSSDGAEPSQETRNEVHVVNAVWVSQAAANLSDADAVQSGAIPRGLRSAVPGPCRMLATPVNLGGRIIGVVLVALRSDEYAEIDEVFLQDIAAMFASALQGGSYIKPDN